MKESKIRILIACEESQAVCKAFRARGFEAYSCDILPCSGGHPEWHINDDVYAALKGGTIMLQDGSCTVVDAWDACIAFTPCTYSCNSGIRWMFNPDKSINEKRMSGCQTFAGMLRDILNSDIPIVSCENPIPHKYAVEIIGRKYDQIIQPWQFGHGETKATCLWLKGLPELQPTEVVEGREQRIWKVAPTKDPAERSRIRSKTFPGIAEAMAEQWGNFLKQRYERVEN